MASEGPNNPDVGENINVGGADWGNPGLCLASDNSRAFSGNFPLFTIDGTTDYLRATDFDFAIPTGATIDGIVVEIEKQCDDADSFYDASVRLVKAGTAHGDDKADGNAWPTTDAYTTYGGATDKWNGTWTAADINGTGFGAQIQSQDLGGLGSTVRVDHIRITVYYTSTKIKDLIISGGIIARKR